MKEEVSEMIEIKLDEIMKKRKITNSELSGWSGVRPNTISDMRKGDAKAIRLESLDAICDSLNCQVAEILEFKKITKNVKKTLA